MSKGNLKRNGGEWATENTLPTTDPDDSIPKTGWVFVSGQSALESHVYYNGKPVKNIRSMDYNISAGGIPVMKLEIVAPEIRMVGKGIKTPKRK
jgi:hypothetical protein